MSEFLADNWLVIVMAAYAAWSEYLPFNKKWQSNGIVHFFTLFLGKLLKK